MKKKIYYYSDRQLEGISWTAKVIDFGVSLTVSTAFNELYMAHMMLRERKDLYRQQVKKLANEAIERAKIQRGQMMNLMANRKFFDTYSDKVIDLAENDITLFRISIKQTLDSAGYKDAELISYIETARSLLNAASVQFREVMKTAREDYGGYPFEKTFCEFDCSDVLKAWDKMCLLLYDTGDDINLNTPNSTKLFDSLCQKFADGVYVEPCLKEAHEEQPEWVENHILVRQ